MLITKQTVAEKIAAYLRHEITLSQLVDWAEQAMMDGQFDDQSIEIARAVVVAAWCRRRPRLRPHLGRLRIDAAFSRLRCPRRSRTGLAILRSRIATASSSQARECLETKPHNSFLPKPQRGRHCLVSDSGKSDGQKWRIHMMTKAPITPPNAMQNETAHQTFG